MKKILIGVVSIVLTMSMVVFADDVAEFFNLVKLGETAVENSITIDSKTLTLENKKIDLEEVEDAVLNASQIGGDRVTYINNRIKVESNPIVAEMEVWKAEKSLEKAPLEIKDDIYKKGMNYLLLKEELALNKVLLENFIVYKSNMEMKVENGLATSTDLVNKTIDVQSQEMKILELESSIDAAIIEINHLLGATLDAELKIDDTIRKMNFDAYDVKKIFAENQATYPSVYENTVLLEARTIEFDLYASKYVERDKEYKTALYNKQMAEINLKDARNSYEITLTKAYNSYMSAYETYALREKQLELQVKLAQEIKLRYDLGLVNTEDVLKADEAKARALFAVTQSIVSFNTSKLELINLK